MFIFIFILFILFADAETVEVDPDLEFNEQLVEFKNDLCNSVVNRFTTDKEKGGVVLNEFGKKRNIVTVDVCNEHSYIMASLLDPRVKTVPFEGNILNVITIMIV